MSLIAAGAALCFLEASGQRGIPNCLRDALEWWQCHDCSCQKVLGLATLCWWLPNVKVKLSHWFHRCISTSLKCVSFSAKRDISCQCVWNAWMRLERVHALDVRNSCECIRNVSGMCPEMMWGRHHSARGLVRGHPVLSDPGSNAFFAKGWVKL